APRELEHLVGHVEADRAAPGADATSGNQHVGAGTRAQVEDRLAVVQVSHGGRDAATEGGRDRPWSVSLRLLILVEGGAEHPESVLVLETAAAPAVGCC